MIHTMTEDISHPTDLYVWGNDESSELGLSQETIEANKTHCE
jgi:hypothetical protein